MTAVHPAEAANLIPESLFESNSLIDAFSSKTSIKDSSVEVHALTILARMMADEELSRQAKPMSPEGLFQLMKDNGPSVLRYLEDWKFDASDPATVNRKLAELHWALSLIYVSAWNPGELLDNDFFLYVFFFLFRGIAHADIWALRMHLVTSSVFLPSFLSKLSPKDQWLLLTRHFAVALVGWLARGRRMVDIKVCLILFLVLSDVPCAHPSYVLCRPSFPLICQSKQDLLAGIPSFNRPSITQMNICLNWNVHWLISLQCTVEFQQATSSSKVSS